MAEETVPRRAPTGTPRDQARLSGGKFELNEDQLKAQKEVRFAQRKTSKE